MALEEQKFSKHSDELKSEIMTKINLETVNKFV